MTKIKINEGDEIFCIEKEARIFDCYKTVTESDENDYSMDLGEWNDINTVFSKNAVSWTTRNGDGERVIVVRPEPGNDLECTMLGSKDKDNNFAGSTLQCIG